MKNNFFFVLLRTKVMKNRKSDNYGIKKDTESRPREQKDFVH